MAYVTKITIEESQRFNLYINKRIQMPIVKGTSPISNWKDFSGKWYLNGEIFESISRISVSNYRDYITVYITVPRLKGELYFVLEGAGEDGANIQSNTFELTGKVDNDEWVSNVVRPDFIRFTDESKPTDDFKFDINMQSSPELTIKSVEVYQYPRELIKVIPASEITDNKFSIPPSEYKWVYFLIDFDHIDGVKLKQLANGPAILKYIDLKSPSSYISKIEVKDSAGRPFTHSLNSSTVPNGYLNATGAYSKGDSVNYEIEGGPTVQLYGSFDLKYKDENISAGGNITEDVGSSYSDAYMINIHSYIDNSREPIADGEKISIVTMDPINNNEVIIGELTSQTYEHSVVSPSRFKIKSMPPIDINDTIWEAEFDPNLDFIPNGDKYIVFNGGEFNTNNYQIGEVLFKNGPKYAVLLDQLQLAINGAMEQDNKIEYSIGYESCVVYPDEKLLVSIGSSSSGDARLSFAPLILTGKEKVNISLSGTVVNGSTIQLTCNEDGFSPINRGISRHQWYKDGVEIPGQISKVLRLTGLSSADTGKYTVVMTAYPSSMFADDSLIAIASDEFEINLGEPVKMELSITAPTNIVSGVEFTVTGTLTTDKPDAIIKIALEKDNQIIKEFDKSLTAFEYKKVAELSDAGNYQFVVTYMDGKERTAVSESKPVSFTDDIEISLSTNLIMPGPVAEGDKVTIKAEVTVHNRAAPPVIEYQWYHRGVLMSGKDDNELVIDNVTFVDDAGEYFFKASVSSPGYIPVQVDSDKKILIVKHDIHLRPTIVADSTIVADGKPAKLSVSFTSDVPVTKVWAWYHNYNKIPGSDNKYDIEHIAYGDATYIVKAHATQEESGNPVLGLNVDSNVVVVRGVVAVEQLTLDINGIKKVTLEDFGKKATLIADLSKTSAPPSSNPINLSDYTYVWYNAQGIRVSNLPSYNFTIGDTTLGRYYYIIRSKVDGKVSKRSPDHIIYFDDGSSPPLGDCNYFMHDLNPGRNNGFTWVGWWVMDEIRKAQEDGFDWKNDPTNERFKYKCVLKTIADAMNRFDDVEIQESKNGYILNKDDLI